MKAEVKQYGRKKTGNDIRDKAGRLDLRAASLIAAQLVSMLYLVVFGVGVKDEKKHRLMLWRHLRRQLAPDMAKSFPKI